MKFVFLPMEGTGHVLTCIGLAHHIIRRGHQVLFIVTKAFNKYIEPYGYEARFLIEPTLGDLDDPQLRWAENTLKHAIHFRKPPLQQIPTLGESYEEFTAMARNVNDQIAMLLNEVKPDFMFVDYYVTLPAVVKSGIPWAHVNSANPLAAYAEVGGPPPYSGLSPNSDKSIWPAFDEAYFKMIKPVAKEYAKFLTSRGVTLPEGRVFVKSSYVNIYVYPREVDYTEIGQTPDRWLQIDGLIRCDPGLPMGVDLNYLSVKRKVIYFSLGSMGSADVTLMKRLLSIFAQSPHQFVVSKGPNHDKFNLPDNMIGSKFINQIALLPRVDLVIFHGGNNTFVECFYHGKPMIILPLFGDQFDNATRLVDKRLGYSFPPYQVDDKPLLEAIESMLTDNQIAESMKTISQRIQSSNRINEVLEIIEKIASSPKQ